MDGCTVALLLGGGLLILWLWHKDDDRSNDR